MEHPISYRSDRRYSAFHSIRFKVILAVAVAFAVLLVFSLWLLTDSMNYVEQDLMNDRLAADIRYLRDELDPSDGAQWHLQDGALYLGDILIGDGTLENANEAPLYHCEEITGTFFYTFLRTFNDDELGWVEEGSYQQGHYLRAAGTTKGPNGENIEGTYIDKKVADALENSPDGIYAGEANVNGRRIYCRYELLKDSNGEIVGIISNGRSAEEMVTIVKTQKIRGTLLIIAAMLLMCVSLGAIIASMLGAIRQIKLRLRQIGTGDFPEQPLHLKTKDEMGDIAESVNEMVESLKEKERIGAELSVATHIQSSMLPCIFPPFPGYDEVDIFATMDPAKEVGGDFYDYFLVDSRHVAIVMADVSGKGVPAALFMVIAKTLLKDHTQPGRDLGEVFSQVNDILCQSNSQNLFVTVFEGVLDLVTGEFRFVNAGHEKPFICRKNGVYEVYNTRAGFVLAGMDGMRYKAASIMLEPGDKIFQYTDGVTEATNADKKLYGMDRLQQILIDNSDKTPSQLLPIVKADIDKFVDDAPQFDDITMLCLHYKSRMPADQQPKASDAAE